MLEKILEYERGAFLWLNGGHNTFWDSFMWLYTGQIVWIPVLLLFVFLLFYKKDWKESLMIILSIVLIITLCDQITSSIIKPTFMRFRPTHHPDFMDCVHTVNNYRGGLYGFISSHAANAFGFATFTLLLFRNRLFTITILIWSTLMAYTRIYLGVHFISDIIPGILVGMLIGFGIYKLYVFLRYKLLKKNNKTSEIHTESVKKLIITGLYATILFLLVYCLIIK
jgi:undecaprenyl-diphosphatase